MQSVSKRKLNLLGDTIVFYSSRYFQVEKNIQCAKREQHKKAYAFYTDGDVSLVESNEKTRGQHIPFKKMYADVC